VTRVSNPLADIPQDVLFADVEAFCEESGMADVTPLMKKGALVAQNPANYENIGLEEDEKETLRIEVTRKWKHPMKLYITVVVCSIGAAVQGWDQTGSNGANLSFPIAFGIPDSDTLEDGSVNPDAEKNLWLVGLINAAPYIASAFLGWCSDPLNFYFGRRGAISISAIFLILTPIGSALSQTWEQLFICRILMGIGMGLKGSTTPIFA
jgi:Sugar (and other) transporter